VDRSIRAKDGASDHAPAWIRLDAQKGNATHPRRRRR
jgi:hypothetical protein